jgi:hypothetical protein
MLSIRFTARLAQWLVFAATAGLGFISPDRRRRY